MFQFVPQLVADCSQGGNHFGFESGFAPVFNCSFNGNVTQNVNSFVSGGESCHVVGFEKCLVQLRFFFSNILIFLSKKKNFQLLKLFRSACNPNKTASIQRHPNQYDRLVEQSCAKGYTGRLCAECVRNTVSRLWIVPFVLIF